MKAETDLFDVVAGRAAKILQEEIDWEVMRGVYESTGWKAVTVNWGPILTEKNHITLYDWLAANVTGAYKSRDRTWLFENEKDAIMFTLRWQ